MQTNVSIKPKMKDVLVTPQKAVRWLEKNGVNRPLNERLVNKYATDMLAKRWDLNGESIKIASDGTLIDGQHRLTACIRAGVPFTTMVAFGLPASSMKNVDTGKSRSFADRLSLEGKAKYLTSKAAVTRLIYLYTTGQNNPTLEQLSDLYKQSEAEIDVAVEAVMEWRGLVGNSTPVNLSAAAFCLMLFRKKNAELAQSYVEQLVTGENLSRFEPAFAVRNRIIRAKDQHLSTHAIDQIAMFIRGWNALRKNRPLSRVYAHGKSPEEGSQWRELPVA